MATRFPTCPAYVLYGNRTDEILRARDAIVEALLPAELRNENLTEYFASSNQPVRLAALHDEIAGDFATMSFIPGAPKIVVVTNPAELFAAAPRGGGARAAKEPAEKKASAEGKLISWIEHDLPASGNHLILLGYEDEAAGREVSDRAPLMAALMKVGFTQAYRETKAVFRIEDAIASRDLDGCLRAIRDLWKGGKGDQPVYSAVLRCIRFMMQANIVRDKRVSSDPTLQAALFPGDAKGLLTAHPQVKRKYMGGPIYRSDALIAAHGRLLEVYRAMRPRPGAVYVADAQGLLEQLLVELIKSPAPPRG